MAARRRLRVDVQQLLFVSNQSRKDKIFSLAKMAEEGMDLYCSLPILSTYLGHQSLRATNNYVRLTSEMYPELIRKIDIIGFDIFPKM